MVQYLDTLIRVLCYVGFKGLSNLGFEEKGLVLMLLWKIFLEELDFDIYFEEDGSCGLEKRNDGIRRKKCWGKE